MLTQAAKDDGATKVLDMQSRRASLWIAPAFVLFYNRVEISGNAVK